MGFLPCLVEGHTASVLWQGLCVYCKSVFSSATLFFPIFVCLSNVLFFAFPLLVPTTPVSDPNLCLSPVSLFSHCLPSLLLSFTPPCSVFYVPFLTPRLVVALLSFQTSVLLFSTSCGFPCRPFILLVDEAEDVTVGSWIWKWAQVSHFALSLSDLKLDTWPFSHSLHLLKYNVCVCVGGGSDRRWIVPAH